MTPKSSRMTSYGVNICVMFASKSSIIFYNEGRVHAVMRLIQSFPLCPAIVEPVKGFLCICCCKTTALNDKKEQLESCLTPAGLLSVFSLHCHLLYLDRSNCRKEKHARGFKVNKQGLLSNYCIGRETFSHFISNRFISI